MYSSRKTGRLMNNNSNGIARQLFRAGSTNLTNNNNIITNNINGVNVGNSGDVLCSNNGL